MAGVAGDEAALEPVLIGCECVEVGCEEGGNLAGCVVVALRNGTTAGTEVFIPAVKTQALPFEMPTEISFVASAYFLRNYLKQEVFVDCLVPSDEGFKRLHLIFVEIVCFCGNAECYSMYYVV